jgi:succinate-semialdehyde dehydrogenase/glutarate-semialdehyde dehydrogenase
VHEKVLEAFVAELVARVTKLKLGKGVLEGTTQGPLVNAAAVKKVQEHVEDAVSKGAVVRTGGKPPADSKGYFFEPTIVTGVTKEMQVMSDETFGPLAAIVTFASEDEVLQLANDTEFGLAGYFYSSDIRRIMRVARQLQCGMIGVNTGLISAAESPFGGVKESGIGREGSKYGLAEYQNIKAVTIGSL